jgi:hypothetical protein
MTTPEYQLLDKHPFAQPIEAANLPVVSNGAASAEVLNAFGLPSQELLKMFAEESKP